MGIGSSIGKFNGLTTAGGRVLFDAGPPARNTGSLILNCFQSHTKSPSSVLRTPSPPPGEKAGLRGQFVAIRTHFSISHNPGALGGNPNALSFNPEILRFDLDALSRDPHVLGCDPDALRFDPDGLRIDPETLSFDVFHQKRGSNGLIFSHLRLIVSKSSKIETSARPAIHRSGVSAERRKPLKIEAFGFLPKAATLLLQKPQFGSFSKTFNIQHSTLN